MIPARLAPCGLLTVVLSSAAPACSSIEFDEMTAVHEDSGRGTGAAGDPYDDPTEPDGETDGHDDTDLPEPGDAPPGTAARCPSPLPEGWVFCEDFESVKDPTEVFFEFQDAEGRFVLVDDEGASGTRSLRATYEAGRQSAGWLNVAFGRNPIAYGARPHVAPDEDFEEIYWRLRIKMQAGWPDVGPHKLARLSAFAHDDWSQAVMASLASNGADVTLMGDSASCVIDGVVTCEGFNDHAGLSFLEPLFGETPLFSAALSGEWHCVEGHVKLNTLGKADGVFEFWIDDHLESGAYEVDWRGVWSEYGLNLLAIENYWTDGAPERLHRWIDDIVIATEPIGCD